MQFEEPWLQLFCTFLMLSDWNFDEMSMRTPPPPFFLSKRCRWYPGIRNWDSGYEESILVSLTAMICILDFITMSLNSSNLFCILFKFKWHRNKSLEFTCRLPRVHLIPLSHRLYSHLCKLYSHSNFHPWLWHHSSQRENFADGPNSWSHVIAFIKYAVAIVSTASLVT